MCYYAARLSSLCFIVRGNGDSGKAWARSLPFSDESAVRAFD